MELLMWFKKTYPDIVSEMKQSDHDYSLEHQSQFHTEGDVFTHTMMVYNLLQGKSLELRLAALLHDIGKPSTRREKIVLERHYCNFVEHENRSVFLAIDILHQFEKDFQTKINKPLILKAISWHQKLHKIGKVEGEYFSLKESEISELNYLFGKELDLYFMLTELGRADALGRICIDFKELRIRYDYFDNFIPSDIFHNEENRPKAYFLAGLPTSGKSTFAANLMKEDEYVYLSTDEILMEKSKGREYRMMWDEDALEDAETIMFERLKDAIEKRQNIIVDRVNITEKMRRRTSSIVPDKHYHKESVSFLIGERDLKKRNDDRKKIGKHIPYDILFDKTKAFSLPGGDMFHSNKIIVVEPSVKK